MLRKAVVFSLFFGVVVSGCSPAPEAVEVTETAPLPPAPPAPVSEEFPGRDPSIRWDSAGRLHVVYVRDAEGRDPWLEYRRLAPEATAPVQVSPPERAVRSRGETAPLIEVQPNGRIVVAYTVTLEGFRQGEFIYQTSSDDGATWSDAQTVHDDGRPTGSRSYVDSTLLPDGGVAFSWLDNRMGQQGLIYAELDSQGEMQPNVVLDAVTCQCCGTEVLADSKGSVFVAYRELDEETGFRDIEMMRRLAGEDGFSPIGGIAPDGWKIDGCPHTGPRLVEAADGDLWSVWFTGAEPPRIRVARSSDGGETFSAPEDLALVAGETRKIAHPEIGLQADGMPLVLYERGGESFSEIVVRRASGSIWQAPEVIAQDAAYPRFESQGGRNAAAWTQRAGENETAVVVRELR